MRALGEYFDLEAGQGAMSLLSGLVSFAALGIFALFQSDAENDDDDSNSGGDGGLMQPIA
jgi:hypothetical protein